MEIGIRHCMIHNYDYPVKDTKDFCPICVLENRVKALEKSLETVKLLVGVVL